MKRGLIAAVAAACAAVATSATLPATEGVATSATLPATEGVATSATLPTAEGVATSAAIPEADAASAGVPQRTVALIVQNHAGPGAALPMMALTDALTAKLSGRGFRVVNPYNAIGTDLNRTSAGEKMPEASAMEIARRLKADGAITASVVDFLDTTIGNPPVLHQFVARVSINLADAQTGAAVCGETVKVKSQKYTNNQVAANRQEYLGDLLHSAAYECADRLEMNPAVAAWTPEKPKPAPPKKRGTFGGDAAPAPEDSPRPAAPTPPTPPTVVPPAPPSQSATPPPAAPPPAAPRASAALTLADIDKSLESLVAAMRASDLFKANYAALKERAAKTPVAVNGGIANLSGGESCDALVESAGDDVRVLLYNTALFDVKDDAAIGAMAKRIVAGGNSPLEDGEIMSALKRHGSPDVLVLGDLRKFGGVYRLRLALHSLASGKILWEGLDTIVK